MTQDAPPLIYELQLPPNPHPNTTQIALLRRLAEITPDCAGSLELIERDGWLFVDNEDAYDAVRIARGGYDWLEPARHRLYLRDQYSPILMQTGRKAVHQSFENVQAAILAAPLAMSEDKLDYTGPNSKRIEFSMCKNSDVDPSPQRPPLIDGKELDLDLKQSCRSPFMTSEASGEVVTVRYGSLGWKYDFGQNLVIKEQYGDNKFVGPVPTERSRTPTAGRNRPYSLGTNRVRRR